MKRRFALLALLLAGLPAVTALTACGEAKVFPSQIKIASYGSEEEGWKPNTVTVKTGQPVVWTNTGINTIHWIISVEKQWEDVKLSSGESFNHTFTTPGTYTYHDSPHEGINTIHVK